MFQTPILGLGLQAGYNVGKYSLTSNQSTGNDEAYDDGPVQSSYSALKGTNFNGQISPYITLPLLGRTKRINETLTETMET